MQYLKIPQLNATDILDLYEASEELLTLAKQHEQPASLIRAAINAELYSDTAIFLAHALPVREAVWWACCCASLRPDWSEDESNAVRAAKAWVHTPDETARRFAEQMATKADLQTGAGWVAQAAFWSGGSMTSPSDPVVPPPANLYAHAVAGAINLCAALPINDEVEGDEAKKRYIAFFNIGLNIAQGGNGQTE
ncbi:Twin-arginine translocation pathway signal [Photobacterium jeanii]|uniref:Twin-arginine translocation pathway signal n=1 Tax=Photobacterium jeanii TaxID=858640 RepID=A0A178KL20_9GAMM|nr:Twin-arginine translocation pathway signal [Photobacterium jeanii]OAN17816.1 Twin-arginine translocation pathway signal [Photobacterium jeanii]PST92518.1 Twin-arginine translocation pathway signal [Photobacterium jeanii]